MIISLCSWCSKPDLSNFSLVCMNCLLRYGSCENCYNELGGICVPLKQEELYLEQYLGVSLESSRWCEKCTLLDQSRPICDLLGDVIFECYDKDDTFAIDGEILCDDVAKVMRKLVSDLEATQQELITKDKNLYRYFYERQIENEKIKERVENDFLKYSN